MSKTDKLIESVREVFKHRDTLIKNNYLDDLEMSLQELDNEQENKVEYKWLAMDEDGDIAIYQNCPKWGNVGFCNLDEWINQNEGFVQTSVNINPVFIKPGQLWERQCEDDGGVLKPMGAESWNGYWWRKVEDHGEQESSQSFESVCQNSNAYIEYEDGDSSIKIDGDVYVDDLEVIVKHMQERLGDCNETVKQSCRNWIGEIVFHKSGASGLCIGINYTKGWVHISWPGVNGEDMNRGWWKVEDCQLNDNGKTK